MPEPPSDGRFYLRQVTDGTGQWVDLVTALNSLLLDGGDFDGRRITAFGGNYTVSGSDSARYIIKTLHAENGTWITSGQFASFIFNRVLKAEGAASSIDGSDADVKVGRIFSAEAGTFNVTGVTGDDVIGYRILGSAGSISLAGTDADIRYNEPEFAFFSSWSAQNYGYETEIYPDGWAE